jgi:hypothetical protein
MTPDAHDHGMIARKIDAMTRRADENAWLSKRTASICTTMESFSASP